MRHQRASKGTRFFRSTASACLLALLGAACSTPGEVSVPDQASDDEHMLATIAFDEKVEPDKDLALINGDGKLFVGDEEPRALAVFEGPSGSYPFSSLPPSFDKNFRAIGWKSSSISFACILYMVDKSERVVLAMYTREDVDGAAVNVVVAEYERAFGQPYSFIPGNKVSYRFWARRGRRLMVNTATNTAGKMSLTVAVGEVSLMDELGMETDAALSDQQDALTGLARENGDS